MSKQMTGAEIIVEALKDQGVDTVFGYPGGAVLPIYDALFAKHDIVHVLVRHEQGATHAAETRGERDRSCERATDAANVDDVCLSSVGLAGDASRHVFGNAIGATRDATTDRLSDDEDVGLETPGRGCASRAGGDGVRLIENQITSILSCQLL